MTSWTDERIQRLKTLWVEGYSASQIAEALGGGFTRCGVLGKVHRLGIADRGHPSNAHAAGWTDEQVSTLTRLWVDGLSASEIGRRLGVSRNAVIGKVHRLGISARGLPADPSISKVRLAKPKAVRPLGQSAGLASLKVKSSCSAPAPVLRSTPMRCEPVGIMDLQPQHCKYPVGVKSNEHLFCAAERSEGRPYCSEHCRIAYTSETPTDKARRKAAALYAARRAA